MPIEEDNAAAMPIEKTPSKTSEMDLSQSPLKKRKMGITAVQKQALVENLQLESMFRDILGKRVCYRTLTGYYSRRTRSEAQIKLQYSRAKSPHADRNTCQSHSYVIAQDENGGSITKVLLIVKPRPATIELKQQARRERSTRAREG
jgi:hypothetical protein